MEVYVLFHQVVVCPRLLYELEIKQNGQILSLVKRRNRHVLLPQHRDANGREMKLRQEGPVHAVVGIESQIAVIEIQLGQENLVIIRNVSHLLDVVVVQK